MKIGILTFHRAHNYGAVLQCYALQEIIKKYGYDVYVINYKQPSIEKCYKTFSFIECIKNIIKFWKLAKYISKTRKKYVRWKNFFSFRKKNFRQTKSCNDKTIPSGFDFYIIGSDQLWSNCIEKVDKVYTGNFHHEIDSKIISYAISTNIDYIKNNFTITQLQTIVKNFRVLSFREKNVVQYFSNTLSNVEANIRNDIDPTLLTDTSIWNNLITDRFHSKYNFKYILVYQARGFNGCFFYLNQYGESLANKYGYKMIDLTEATYKVEEFIYLIKNAECIITSSFHAVVFSLIYNKPFYAYCYNDKGDERYKNLLYQLNLESQLVQYDYIPTNIPIIDYTCTNKRLEEMKINSLQYISNIKTL